MHRVKDFIEKQIIDLEEFSYKIEEEKEFIYVLFSQILGKNKYYEQSTKLLLPARIQDAGSDRAPKKGIACPGREWY